MKPGRKQTISRAEVFKHIEEGCTTRTIAKRMGHKESTIWNLMTNEGCKKLWLTPRQLEHLKKLNNV